MKKLIAVIAGLALVASAFAGGSKDSGSSGKMGTIGIAMPTKSSARWIADGNNMKAEFEKLGFKVDRNNFV